MATIRREILRLAWPAVATNITTPLLSLADAAIAGHAGGGVVIGAVAVGGTMFNVVYWIFAFLRMGTSGPAAQAYGANDGTEMRSVLLRALTVAALASVLILILAPWLGGPVLTLIDADSGVRSLATAYFRTAVWGAPAVLCTYSVSGWLLGMQRPQPIMWVAILTNVVNIALSSTFVFALDMGVRGLALGTACAQWVGAIAGLIVTARILHDIPNTEPLTARRWLNRRALTRYIDINGAIMLRTLCLAAVTLWFTHAGASSGALVLAANSLLMQLFMLFSYFIDGFAFAGEALAGRWYGARQYDMLRLTIRTLLRSGALLALIFSLVYLLGADAFTAFLTDDAETLGIAHRYSLWTAAIPVAGFAAFTWDGIYVGLTRTRAMLASMAIAMATFFISYFVLRHYLTDTNNALWLAFVAYLAVRGVVLALIYRRKPRQS